MIEREETKDMATYSSEVEIRMVVDGFESCMTDKGDFKHKDHLTVAVCYLQNSNVGEATERLRTSLLRFLGHHQVNRQKYNETMTVFWLEVVAEELKQVSARSLLEQCNSVIESLSDAGKASEYYSSELLFSQRARETFVEPDLKSWK
jgi:hypothetical protein